jgi:hypothetical protein
MAIDFRRVIACAVRWLYNPERLIVALLFVTATYYLTDLKMIRVDQRFSDTAEIWQVTENIAFRGVPMSQVTSAILSYYNSGMLTETASQIAQNPLVAAPPELNHLQFHAYLILYPIAVLVRMFPTEVVMMTLYALSFTATVLLSYIALRRAGMNVLGAGLFSAFILFHPAWSEGLRAQFYPDRLFIFFGLLFMLAISAKRPHRLLQFFAALLCLSVNERGAVTASVFTLVYLVLYWRSSVDRIYKLGIAAGLIVYAAVTIKFFLPLNIYNAHFLPTSLADAISRFSLPNFAHNAGIFILVNAIALVLACFNWRAAVIAFVMMVPNILGNIGGAEKTGWTTHYHDEYLSAVIWASLVGFLALYERVRNTRMLVPAFALPATLMLVFAFLDPYTGTFAFGNANNTFVAWFPREVQAYRTPAARQAALWAKQLDAAIPAGVTVSSIEAGIPSLYRNRTIEWYPSDIEHADYAVLVRLGTVYSGVANYLGPVETQKVDDMLVDRMRKDGYDFVSPVFSAPNGIIAVRRNH